MATVLGVLLIAVGLVVAGAGRLAARAYGRDSTGRRIGIWLLFFAAGLGACAAGFEIV
ncbi:hypothetical protein [Streptomyces sp. NPDC049040]|uniref:hypothetical protein n=1 Tax=Streptomyces sp. NPDC049040 TaxID=3365593 RepID=UPI00372264AF